MDVDTNLFTWEDNDPEGACINYEQCGNRVPHNGQICGPCLDRVRHADE